MKSEKILQGQKIILQELKMILPQYNKILAKEKYDIIKAADDISIDTEGSSRVTKDKTRETDYSTIITDLFYYFLFFQFFYCCFFVFFFCEKWDFYKNFMKYDSNEKQIFIEILDNNRVSRKAFSMKKEYSYDIKIFNKGILDILEKEFTYKNYYSFESLFRNINYGYEEKFIEPFKEKYLEIISKILKSNAAEQFFNSYYGNHGD